jgi:hypothetical protein
VFLGLHSTVDRIGATSLAVIQNSALICSIRRESL